MTIEFILPKSGMGIKEGTIEKWHKAEGDTIAKGDILVDVETAKAMEEIESPIDGVLEKILVPEGESIEVDIVLALLAENE